MSTDAKDKEFFWAIGAWSNILTVVLWFQLRQPGPIFITDEIPASTEWPDWVWALFWVMSACLVINAALFWYSLFLRVRGSPTAECRRVAQAVWGQIADRVGPFVGFVLAVFLVPPAWQAIQERRAAAEFDVAALLRETTCGVRVLDGRGRATAIATAFFVSDDGHMLTNRDVLTSVAGDVLVECRGKVSAASVSYVSKATDFAVLKTDFVKTPFLRLSRHHPLDQIGRDMRFMGVSDGTSGSAEQGVVGEPFEQEGQVYFGISAAVSRGDSGGPVVDAKGEVIGLVRARVRESQGVGGMLPAFVMLGDSAYRHAVGESGGVELDVAARSLSGSLVDPRTKRLVAFIDQCYGSGPLEVSSEIGGQFTEPAACQSLRRISKNRPRIGLAWLTKDFAMVSVATIYIQGKRTHYYDAFIKRFDGPRRYEVLSVQEAQANHQLPPPIEARSTLFVSELHWLNDAPKEEKGVAGIWQRVTRALGV